MGVKYSDSQSQYEAFKKTANRRRVMKKQYEENLRNISKDLIETLSTISGKEVAKKDPRKEKMYQTLRDTFDAFDKDGSAELGYPEYVEAWKFLDRPGGEKEIKQTFDSVDIDGSGFVEWNEFAFSLMGEDALQFGALADLETLSALLVDTADLLSHMRNDLLEAQGSDEERAKRNAELKKRMKRMKNEVGGGIGKLMNKMLGIMGSDPRDLLTDEQINRLLDATFDKFDKDGSGELEKPEFRKAWEHLGLDGSVDEMNRAFTSVDYDNSGIVDRSEFKTAIKESRATELSLTLLLTNLDGELEGIDDIFNTYKEKLEESKKQAQMNLLNSEEAFKNFQQTVRRRRMMKKQMQEKMAQLTQTLVKELSGETQNNEEYQMYCTIKVIYYNYYFFQG
jgi:Ca2+-binding EF-hand superfamily protein